MRAEKRKDEAARLAALRRYGILDTPPEPALDDLTRHIAHVCQVPIALISLVDAERQWFKSIIGLEGVHETPLDLSFCAHNIVDPGLLEVNDVLADRRFADNPLIRSLELRFYAGHTLESADGYPIGTLCVLDYRPRQLDEAQRFALRTIARQVMIQLELRQLLDERSALIDELRTTSGLRQERDCLAAILDSATDGILSCDQHGKLRLCNRAACRLLGLPEHPPPAEAWPQYFTLCLPDAKTPLPPLQDPLQRALRDGVVNDMELVVVTAGGAARWLLANGRAVLDEQGRKAGAVVLLHDMTARRDAEASRLRSIEARVARDAADDARNRISQILESITDAFFMLDGEWRFTHANKQAELLLRRDREQLLGNKVWQVFPEAVGSQFEREFRKAARERETAKFEAYFTPLAAWFQVSVYPSSEGLAVYFADVTDRKRSEQTLAEQARRLRAVFNQQYQFMAVLSCDGVVTDINDLPLQVGGFAREQVVGKRIWDAPFWAHLPEMQRAWREQINKAIETKARVTDERLFETATGEIRIADSVVTPVTDDAGDVVVLIAEGEDITERKRAEQRLRESEERFRMLVQQVKDYAIFMTDRGGRPSSWNEGVQRILGYSEDEFVGLHPYAMYTLEDVEADVPRKELAEAARIGVASDDRWLVRKGGERFWASGMTTAVRDANGELIGFAKVFRDLTEKKLIEEQLDKAQQQLREYADALEQRVTERTSRLQETISELEAFSYSVSHDLRAPLRAMQGYAQVLLEDYALALDEQGMEYVGRIRNAARRLDQLVQDILTYSQVTRARIELKPLDLERLVHDVVQSYPSLEAARAKVEVRQPLRKVLAHEPSMTQCISNLLDNAVKFARPGAQPHITIWTEPRGEFIRVWFADNGIGIPAEHQQRIFGMFETVHDRTSYGGTGIGLAIVRKAVERMGGTVGVESEPGQGSRFWIELREAR